jgi:hypothetical protein
MGLSLETEQAKAFSIFFHNLSEIPLPFCQNAEVLHHFVTIFVLVLLESHPLNAAVIHFPENSCNTELLKWPSIMWSSEVIA